MTMYYDYTKLLSYNFLLGFVIGERGVGKTFGAKKKLLQNFINKGEEFIYLRRYKTELDLALSTFWDDIISQNCFPDCILRVEKSKKLTTFTCNGITCGYAVPLSTSNILKSTSFPNVKYIVFDEFLIDNSGTYHYLKNEVTMMLDIIETVGRLRDIKVIFLGNAITITNPYFAYFGLDLPYNSEFKTFKNGLIVVNYIKNQAYRDAKEKTRFGQLIKGTNYGDYAINNKMLRDNAHFIEKRPPDSKFCGTLIINKNNIGIWTGSDGYIYLSNKFDPNTTSKFALNFDDHTENTIMTNARENMYVNICLRAFKQGLLRFETQQIKNVTMTLFNRLISC